MSSLLLLAQVPVIRNGKAACTIILPDTPSAAEKTASRELTEHLRLICGQNFQILSERQMRADMPSILIGNTKLAEKTLRKKPEKEEYVIQTHGNRLFLTGGSPRGILYAVYDFLERVAGCRWLDEQNTIIPAKKELTAKDMYVCRKPDFTWREYGDGFEWWGGIPASTLLKHRNKGICAAGKKYGWGGQEQLGYASGAHSFHIYMKKLPQDDLSLWPMNVSGKRVIKQGAFAPAPCLTNPKVQTIFTDTLHEFIARDRKKAKQAGKPYPVVYDLTPNDNPEFCRCAECTRKIQQYGSKSGLLLEFINKIAEKTEAVYPDVQIRTFAYLGTLQPPHGIQPRKNVMIRLAILGKEFTIEGITADTMSSVHSKSNADARTVIEGWKKLTSMIDVWDYWGLNSNLLAVNVRYIGEKLRYYHRNHAVGLIVDSTNYKHAFFGLRRYLVLKLLDDVSRDEQLIIRDYMTGMFGPAADAMTGYLNYLTDQQEKFDQPLGEYSIHALTYMDRAFFLNCLSRFQKAEKSAGTNAVWRRNIRFEKQALLHCLLQRWDKLEKLPYNKKDLVDEYAKTAKEQIEYYFPAKADMSKLFLKKKNNLLAEVDNFVFLAQAKPAKVPAELAGKKVRIVPFSSFIINNRRFAKRTADPEANSGLAVTIAGKDGSKGKARTVDFGLYNQTTRKFHSHKQIPLRKFPQDEKYHLFHAGTLELTGKDPGTVSLFAWRTWNFSCTISNLLSAAEKQSRKKIDVYISCRLSGPDYIPESTKSSGFSVDAVFLVEQ